MRDRRRRRIRATAAQAFRNIDAPLAAGIARWQKALATSPPTFSAHYELAQLAEQRDELDLAAANYRAAFSFCPSANPCCSNWPASKKRAAMPKA